MCIIAVDDREAGARLPKELLQRCKDTYEDGLGMMYPAEQDERVITWRDLHDLDHMWNRYTTARDKGLPVALHFRRTTKGDNRLENCHPFRLNQSVAFMHNGTIRGMDDRLDEIDDPHISDSRLFRNEVLGELPADWLTNPSLRKMVAEFVGRDRLVFMDGGGGYWIFNKHVGFTHDNVWFSHTRDRRYLIRGVRSSGSSYVSHYRGSWCQMCQEWTDHDPAQCPSRTSRSSDREYESREIEADDGCDECGNEHYHDETCPTLYEDEYDDNLCILCGEDHYGRPCPRSVRDGDSQHRCRWCGALGGHSDPTECSEWEKVCPGCGNEINGRDPVKIINGYICHLRCDISICPECQNPVGMQHNRTFINNRAHHQSCIQQDEEPEDEPDFDIILMDYNTQDVEGARNEYTINDYDGLMTSIYGAYYDGTPLCWRDLPDEEHYDHSRAWAIPVNRTNGVYCEACGVQLDQKSAMQKKRSGEEV